MSDLKPDTPTTVLVLRTVNADGTSHGGFRWPDSGAVEAPDWSPVAECGQGHPLAVVIVDHGTCEFCKYVHRVLSRHAAATGDSGHAAASYYGWAIAGYNGQAKADRNGVVTLLYWSKKDSRPRVVTGYVGEDGIKADTWYTVKNGKLTEMESC